MRTSQSPLCIFILIFLFATPLCANDEITVHVSSQEKCIPLYITPISEIGSGFEKNYIVSLEKVIRFDFEHNGITETVSSSKDACILETVIKQKVLHMKLSQISIGGAKGIEGVTLTGNLNKDRQTLHRVHDSLLAAQFGKPGIASHRILYTIRVRKSENSTGWLSDVWEADYDGANAKQATHENCLIVTPTFVPTAADGRSRNFLYVSYKAGQPKIFAAALGEGVGKRLTFLRGNQLMPSIAPTLDKMAFISDITGNPDLFIQDFSLEKGLLGTPRQIFSAPGATQGSPTFSPNGKTVAFVSNKDGTPRIYILDIPKAGASLKNLKPKMISKKARDNTCPAWSPDGKKIVYSALVNATRQIWIYDLETGEESQLTSGSGHKENPSWASNSLHLMFNSCGAGVADLYMINLNQKKAVKITQGPGEKRFPVWEPKK